MKKAGRPKLSDVAICSVSIAGLSAQSSYRSHLVSQILFGERVRILSRKNKDWFRVMCEWDGIVGWVDPKQLYVVKVKELAGLEELPSTFALDHMYGLRSSNATVRITLGSNLPECDGINVKLPFGHYQYNGQIVNLEQSRYSAKLLVRIAMKFLHSPHMSGGRSIMGLDASSMTQLIYKLIGINLPRSLEEQAQLGEDIGFPTFAQAGDLAFCASKEEVVDTVGIVLDEGQVLHLYGRVRLDVLDHQGIYDASSKRYLSKLKSIRRLRQLVQ